MFDSWLNWRQYMIAMQNSSQTQLDPPSEICVANSDAPLGLEFEWPESLWVLDQAETHQYAATDCGNFYKTFRSEADAVADNRRYRNWRRWEPEEVSFAYLMESARAFPQVHGIALMAPPSDEPVEVFYVR